MPKRNLKIPHLTMLLLLLDAWSLPLTARELLMRLTTKERAMARGEKALIWLIEKGYVELRRKDDRPCTPENMLVFLTSAGLSAAGGRSGREVFVDDS